MSTIARDPLKPIMMVVALGYVMMLAAALIWLHLSPLIILGMTVGGVALTACTLRPILAIHGLIMLLHCQAVLARSDVGDLAAKGMGAVIVLSWVLNMAVNRKRRIQIDGLVLMMILFVLWCGSLIMVSIDSRVATGRTMTFVQLVVGAIIFASVVDSSAKLRTVYRAFVAWTAFSALIGIAQYLSGMPQAVGLIGNRNSFAMYVNIALVCAYLLHQGSRRPIEKIMLAMSIPVLFLALALTFSRAGLIALGVAMTFVLFKAARERRFQILIASSVLIVLIAAFLPAAFWSRAGSIVPSIQRQEDTFGLRVSLWKAGIRMVADHPITGVGPGNFKVALPKYAQGVMMGRGLGAHNSYVSVAAEMGTVGLALFLLLHVIVLRRIHRASAEAVRSDNKDIAFFALTAETCIYVIMLTALSGHLEYTKYLWIFFGLAIALSKLPELDSGTRESVHPEPNCHALRPSDGAADMNRPQVVPGD